MLQQGSWIIKPQDQTRYQLERKLGEGAFGEVWKARALYGGSFAVKILKKFTPSVFETWNNEVLIGLQANYHPHIVHMFDYFCDMQYSYYVIIMELANGSLESSLATLQRAFSPGQVKRIGCQILSALDKLHNLPGPVLHRDVSVKNILHFNNGVYKLADFGISRQLKGVSPISVGKTCLQNMVPPELISLGYTSTQSDIYQLGFVLLTLLLNRTPIGLDCSPEQIRILIGEGQPRQLAEQLVGTHGKVADCVSVMLRRRLEWRYQSAREALAALSQC